MNLFGEKGALEVMMEKALKAAGLSPEMIRDLVINFANDHAQMKADIAELKAHLLPSKPLISPMPEAGSVAIYPGISQQNRSNHG